MSTSSEFRPPRVFISYSHDSDAHKREVLALASRLRQDGVDAIIDQYTGAPPEGWPHWIEHQITEADFVLLVITDQYLRRLAGPTSAEKGVLWESSLVHEQLNAPTAKPAKFIPVLFREDVVSHLPSSLRGAVHYILTSADGYASLCQRLTNQPKTQWTQTENVTAPKISPNIFVSYSNEDRHIAEMISKRLQASGLQPWLAHQALARGDSIRETIGSVIGSSDFFIILLSRNSVQSEWVRHELMAALQELSTRDITILPVLLEDCDVPTELRRYTWFDLRGRTPTEMDNLVAAIQGAPLIDFSAMTPATFERLVADLLRAVGFDGVVLSTGQSDSGVDITADLTRSDPFGAIEVERWLVQVKHSRSERLRLDSLRLFTALVLTMKGPHRGLLVTNAILTSVAKEFLQAQQGNFLIRVVEGPELKRLLTQRPELVRLYFPADQKSR